MVITQQTSTYVVIGTPFVRHRITSCAETGVLFVHLDWKCLMGFESSQSDCGDLTSQYSQCKA